MDIVGESSFILNSSYIWHLFMYTLGTDEPCSLRSIVVVLSPFGVKRCLATGSFGVLT